MDMEIYTICLHCRKRLDDEAEKANIAFCSDCYEIYKEDAWHIS